MEKKTLREICDTYGISRRTVQGYEKENLISPSGKNHLGHLLYDEETRQRIGLIRFYQKAGFRIKEIGELLELPKKKRDERLLVQIRLLEEKKTQTETIIRKLEEMIREN